jgi:hypothetical protein
MAIQSLNPEQQNIAISNRFNQFSNAQLIQKLISPDVKAQVERLTHQPLLLEKILIQQNDELLINLKPNKPVTAQKNQSILVKIPAKSPTNIETLIKQLESANKISISINKNQQIQINISIPSSSKDRQLVLLKSEITPSGQINLSQLLPQVTGTKITDTKITPTIDTKAQVKTLGLHNNLGKIAANLITQNSNPSEKLTTNFTKIETLIPQVKKQLITQLNTSTLFNNYAKQIEKISTHKNLTLDSKNIESVKSTSLEFIKNIKAVHLQIQNLFENISKPISLANIAKNNASESTKNLVSRLVKSGNLFESALKQRAIKNDAAPQNNSLKVPSDNKLILNQLITQLERLTLEINRYLEKPITANQIEKIERSLLSQSKDFTPLEKHQLETSKKSVLLKIQVQQEQLQSLNRINQSLQASIKSSLQQIEQNQLHSLKSEQFNLQQFLVDLPIKQNGLIDSFEMRFESQDNKKSGVKKKFWKVVVRFDLEPLGPMFAEIQFENEKLSTHLFAQEVDTAQLINQHLPTLRKSLFSAGVAVNKVSGSQGNVPEDLKKQEKPNVDTHV